MKVTLAGEGGRALQGQRTPWEEAVMGMVLVIWAG